MRPIYRVDLVVEKKSHFYDVTYPDGTVQRFAGVTGHLSVINKPALIPWAVREALQRVRYQLLDRVALGVEKTPDALWIDEAINAAKKIPDRIKDDAADVGTRTHAIIDKIIHGVDPGTIPDDLQTPVMAFKDWWKSSGIELILGDTKVASPQYEYGGSLDALGRREGKLIILDWKTSNGIYPEMALQVAAYGQAFYETYGIYCQQAIIVRFGKKLPVDFETQTVRDLDRSFEAFLAAKRLSELMKEEHFNDAN